jgi:multidrug resistance efflux pump
MSFKRLVMGLIVLAAVGAGGWWLLGQASGETGTPTAAASAPVATASANSVAAEGRIVPLRHAELAFQTSGQVVEILVQEGDAVTAGDPLLRLDPRDHEIAVTQAQANLAQAKADVKTANAGLLGAQTALVAAQLAAKTAEAQLALAQAEPLPQEIAMAGSSIDIATANITHTLANRDLTLEGARDAEIRAAEAQVKEAYLHMLQARYERDELNKADDLKDDEKVRAQMQLNAAIVNLDAAEAALDELLAGATAGERRAAEGAVSGALAQRDAAQAQLELLLAGAKPEQIAVAEAGVEQTAKAVAEAELAAVGAGQAVAGAEARVAQAQAALDAAQATLERMTLTAPFDGTVADISVTLGETVSPGVPALTLADMTGWLVETTDLSELDVGSVAVGDRVEVEVDALPDQVLTGTFTDIASVSSLVRGDVTYVVTVRLDDLSLQDGSEHHLRWGMTAYVQVGQ